MVDSSIKHSKKRNVLLNGMKRYLRIEHEEDDKKLLDYLRKHTGLHQDRGLLSLDRSSELILLRV